MKCCSADLQPYSVSEDELIPLRVITLKISLRSADTTNTQPVNSELTPTHPAVTHKPRQAGADVGGASAVAAQSSLRSITVMTSSLTVIQRAVLLCRTRQTKVTFNTF